MKETLENMTRAVRRPLTRLALGAALAATVTMPVEAQVLLGNCTVVVQAPGKVTINAGLNSLSSKNSGGTRARATITTNSTLCVIATLLNCYAISTPPPLTFASSPSGANTGTVFSTSFYLNGGAERPGAVPVLVVNGQYNMEVDLTATKAVGLFPAGNYTGQVTLRCE